MERLITLPYAAPAIRKLARELGIDLTTVAGSGNKGRVTAEDLWRYLEKRHAAPPFLR